MAFQGTINRLNTYGIQGDVANGQVPHYTPTTPRVKADETIYAGDFVWVTDDNGVATCEKTSESGHTTKPTGIVQRVQDVPLASGSEASLQIPAGRKADVVVWGDMFVKVSNTSSAAVGQKIYVNLTTGAITCAATGDATSGIIETDWEIVSLANNAKSATGSVVVVSNVR